jgi:hypothetical protein
VAGPEGGSAAGSAAVPDDETGTGESAGDDRTAPGRPSPAGDRTAASESRAEGAPDAGR